MDDRTTLATISLPSSSLPALGTREVVGFPLEGGTSKGEARALLVGGRIDTRNLQGFVEPEHLALDGLGAVFVFRFGVVVLVGGSPEVEQKLLDRLAANVIDPLPQPVIETASIETRAAGDERVDSEGRIILRNASWERLLLTATVLARSVVLERDEIRMAAAFDRIEPLVAALQSHGRAGLPIDRIMQHIGDVLAARHRVIGRVQIIEKPDVLWDHPELDRLYNRLETEFELVDRARALERKLEVIGDAADVLLDLVKEKRAVRLELAIIALIAFEIFLTLYEMWHA